MIEIIVLLLVMVLALLIAALASKSIKTGGAEKAVPTYLFSGYDGSYLWYLAELLRADGALPASETGFVMRGENTHASYLHRSLDNLYWFEYDYGPASGNFENVIRWPRDIKSPIRRPELYSLIDGKPYAPNVRTATKFKYDKDKKYIAHTITSDTTLNISWGGWSTKIISNERDYSDVLMYHYKTMVSLKKKKPMPLFETFIVDLIPSRRINDRAFVLTMYVMLDGDNLRVCNYGFICLSRKPDSLIAICDNESTVLTFPQEYTGDSDAVMVQIRDIVADCEQFFRPAASQKNYKVYNMDILIDENEKCWLLEFNSYFAFYDMLPEPPYSDAMRGIMEWTYKYGIKPRLFGSE